MSGRTTRYQGGSIVSFIIIAVLVAAAVGIGLHTLRQRSDKAKIGLGTSQTVPAELPGATGGNKDESSKEGAKDSNKDAASSSNAETFPSSAKQESSKEEKKPDSSTGSTGADSAARPSDSTASPTASSQSSSVAALPETGPEQLLIVPVLAAVVYVAVAYAGSSRTLARLR